MMRFRLRTSLALLLLGFVAGFCTSFLFKGRGKSSPPEIKASNSPKQLKKEANNIEISYQKQIEALRDQNIELQRQLEVSRGLLQQAKREVKQKEVKIKKIIEPPGSFLAKDLLVKPPLALEPGSFLKDVESPPISNNQLSKPCFCDSLAGEVMAYIEANHRKDSLYELQLIQFDSIVSTKDLVIETSFNAYSDLHLLFDKSLSDQTALQKENAQLKFQSKRQRFKNKLVTAGLMVMSGFAANYFLHR